MARLTEEMVIARTRASDLSNIRKLNCWGSELSDVSLLRRMHNVEVLSLSVNKIGTLSDFQFCRNLQELYVRKNNIQDLNQILYLQELPRLKSLWLEENPCADTEAYRMTVLRALPNLQKLDNVVVQPEEVQDALRKGRELVHPDDMQDISPSGSGSSSPAHSPSQHERSPPRRQDRELEQTEMRRHSSIIQEDDQHGYYETDRRNANYETENPVYMRQHSGTYSSPYERSPTSTNSHPEEASPLGSMKEEINCSLAMSSSMPLMKEDQLYDQRVQLQKVSGSDKGNANSRPPYPRRPITRSSNILSAVLCLIKELDYPNLEVVEMAVRSRMDEL